MKGSNSTLRLGSSSLNSLSESSSSKSVLLTDSRSEVGTKIWFSKISGSKLILSLIEKQVRSSFDAKEDDHEFESSSDSKFVDLDNEMSKFSDELEESCLKRVFQKFQK